MVRDGLKVTLETCGGNTLSRKIIFCGHGSIAEDMIGQFGTQIDQSSIDLFKFSTINSLVLKKVLEDCSEEPDEELQSNIKDRNEFQETFRELLQSESWVHNTYDIIFVAKYLDMQRLVEAGLEYLASSMKGRSIHELDQIFVFDRISFLYY
jgi:hypothetical protein